MTKLAVGVLLLLTLAGCGVSPVAAAASRAAQLSTAMAAVSGMVVSSASLTEGPSPDPGHLLPVTEDLTVVGKNGGKSFTIAIHAVNPGGQQYVPTPASVTLNGDALSNDKFAAMGAALNKAKTKASDKNAVMRAASILELAH